MEQNQIDHIPTIEELLPISSIEDTGLFYVPSSIQKKRAVMLYLLMGIVMVINEKKTNEFEYFHLKQSIGWWVGFLVMLLVSTFLLFIPYIRFLGILLLFVGLVFLGFFVKQARDGKYIKDLNVYRGAVFPSLGNWVMSLFDLSFDEQKGD